MTTDEILESMRFIHTFLKSADCGCDPEVNHRCETCGIMSAIGDGIREIERLRAIVAAKLHQRRCHDCGHVGWYADGVLPYCACDRCGSQDTRRVRD